jgi:site-specific recombinase XerD
MFDTSSSILLHFKERLLVWSTDRSARTATFEQILKPTRRQRRFVTFVQREVTNVVRVRQRAEGSPYHGGLAGMIECAAVGAGLVLKAHRHMLRHACGYALANKGHDTRAIQGWLGHRSITSTAGYTVLAPNRFKDFWRE